MDISKILDFHRTVMMSLEKKSLEDETSCASLCQHPSCWYSNRRRERGLARIKKENLTYGESEIGKCVYKITLLVKKT